MTDNLLRPVAAHQNPLGAEIENIHRNLNLTGNANVTTVATGSTLSALHAGLVEGDTTLGAMTTTLPSASGNAGLTFTFLMTVDGGDWTISGGTTWTLSDVGNVIVVRSDGTSWKAISSNCYLSPDEGLVAGWEYNKWSNMQNHLFQSVAPKTYTLDGIHADTVSADSPKVFAVFQGKLYIGSSNTTAATDASAAKLFYYDIATDTWGYYTKADMGFVAADTEVIPCAVYGGRLWLGTANTTAATDGTAASVISFDGTTFTRYTKDAINAGLAAANRLVAADTQFASMGAGNASVFNGVLYISTYNATGATDKTAAKLLTYNAATSAWGTILKSTMGAHNNDRAFWMTVCDWYNGASSLVMGTYNSTAATDATASKILWFTGAAWSSTNKSAMSSAANADFHLGYYGTILQFGGRLIFGTYNTTAATDATAMKLCIYDGTWTRLSKDTYIHSINAMDRMWGCAVYASQVFVGGYANVAATDFTGTVLCAPSWITAISGYYSSRRTKAWLGLVANDLGFMTFGVYAGYLWGCTYNTTAATDNTSRKVWRVRMPISECIEYNRSSGF